MSGITVPSGPKKAAAVAILLAALTLAAYSNSLHAAFHFDDMPQIVNNYNIWKLSNIPRFFTDATLESWAPTPEQATGYRPVTISSFAVSYAISGNSVTGYHLFNLLLHILNAFLVFLIVRLVLIESGGDARAFHAALAASCIFALHPIQTGAVTYISGRAVLLATLFFLLSFLAFLRYRTGSGRAAYIWAVVSPVAYLVGLMSKEMAVSLPLAALAYDLVIATGGRRDALKSALYYIPFAVCATFYLLVRRALTGHATVQQDIFYMTGDYLLSEAHVFLLYLRLLLLPTNQNSDYFLPMVSRPDAYTFISLTVIFTALFLLWRIRRKNPAMAFFGLWFFITLAPESSIFAIPDIAVEYRLYLPAAGFIAMCAAGLAGLAKLEWPAISRKSLAIALVAMLGILTYNRNLVWADEVSLWGDVAKKSPRSMPAHSNLGAGLMYAGRYSEATRELETALSLSPWDSQSFMTHILLAECYYKLGRTDEAEAQYISAITHRPDYLDAYEELGSLYFETGRYDKATREFERLKELSPDDSKALYNLAVSYMMLGHYDKAYDEMKEAIASTPHPLYDMRYNMAMICQKKGLKAEARKEAQYAVGLADNDAEADSARRLMDEAGR